MPAPSVCLGRLAQASNLRGLNLPNSSREIFPYCGDFAITKCTPSLRNRESLRSLGSSIHGGFHLDETLSPASRIGGIDVVAVFPTVNPRPNCAAQLCPPTLRRPKLVPCTPRWRPPRSRRGGD